MATATFDKTLIANSETATEAPGYFGRLFKRIVAAREAEARRRTASFFANWTDRDFARLGLSAQDAASLRKSGCITAVENALKS